MRDDLAPRGRKHVRASAAPPWPAFKAAGVVAVLLAAVGLGLWLWPESAALWRGEAAQSFIAGAGVSDATPGPTGGGTVGSTGRGPGAAAGDPQRPAQGGQSTSAEAAFSGATRDALPASTSASGALAFAATVALNNPPPAVAPDVAPVVMPVPVPLGRETRDPFGAARVAAQQQADHERQVADSAAYRPGQELLNARVTPADLGVSFMPRSAQDPAQSTRTFEPGGGTTVSTQLRSATSLDAALAFYRQELRAKWPQAPVEEERPAATYAVLKAQDLKSGARLTLFLNAVAPGDLSVSISRWQALPQGVGSKPGDGG